MNHLLPAALAAAERGWPVFVLGRSKRPVANCQTCRAASGSPAEHDPHDPENCGHLTCHGFYAATTDPDRVTAMVAAVPGGQLAVRTGAVSGLVVVDVDPAHGGTDSLNALIAERLIPRTLWVRTGSGGLHLYYRHPGQNLPSRPMPERGGIDIKADGGYVVLPPSIHHRTGRPYQWGNGCDPSDPAALTDAGPVGMPSGLVAACLPDPYPVSADSQIRTAMPVSTFQTERISCPDRLLAAHLDAVRNAPEGRRRVTLYGAARGVARMVAAGAISPSDAVAALTDVGQQADQTARDITAAITGGFRDEGIAA